MTTPVDKVKLKKIIQEGDPVELVNCANEFGTALANDRVSKSQIRNVFGEVRNIDVSWSEPTSGKEPKPEEIAADEENSKRNLRRLLLLKPRMAYQGKRDAKTLPLMTTLTDAIDLAVVDKSNVTLHRRFKHFAEFFEAILAYHTAAGGK